MTENDRGGRMTRGGITGISVALGLAVGSTISTLTEQPMWIGVGLALGLAFGALIANRS